MALLQYFVQDAVVQSDDPLFPGFYLEERLVGFLVGIRSFISSALHDRC